MTSIMVSESPDCDPQEPERMKPGEVPAYLIRRVRS
ncbi:hypothetical protein QE385_002975 [Sphingomonas sp. SORGH_AS 950]|nr:hypothetical protein [Sphingomonas sp. SORGH_AS_0950]